jgi:hypothetical protein
MGPYRLAFVESGVYSSDMVREADPPESPQAEGHLSARIKVL